MKIARELEPFHSPVKNTFRKTTMGSAVLNQVIRLLTSIKGKNGATLLRPTPPDFDIVQEHSMSHDSNAECKMIAQNGFYMRIMALTAGGINGDVLEPIF